LLRLVRLLLQENPQILLNLGESNMEDHAEVGARAGQRAACVARAAGRGVTARA
jgi:hypothetical protein